MQNELDAEAISATRFRQILTRVAGLVTGSKRGIADVVVSMVPQGVSNSYIQYAREHAPAFEQGD